MDSQELRELFDFFDVDQNGIIDIDEFKRLLGALGAGMSDEEAAIGFETIDADGNGTIEFDEFRNWWQSQ